MDKTIKIQLIENNSTIKAKTIFQIIVVGDSQVGKTSLIQQGLNNKFIEAYKKSTPFNLFWKNYQINNEIYCIQLWDVCGEEISKPIIGNFYKTCNCVFLVYSVDNVESFNNLNNWLNNLKKYINENIIIILIGNKSDLLSERKISFNEGKQFQEENKLDFFIEISVKENKNVNDLINYTITTLYCQLEYSTKFYEKLNENYERDSTLTVKLRPSTSEIRPSYLDNRISEIKNNEVIKENVYYEQMETEVHEERKKIKWCIFC